MAPNAQKITRLPKLPALLQSKLYKTGQTRGADDDVIYQNRVCRNSTVLIPYSCWDLCAVGEKRAEYENGYITLVSPAEYFGTTNIDADLLAKGLAIGTNALVFYERRSDWNARNPDDLGWSPARNRRAPLGGQYVARIPGTTSKKKDKISRGFKATKKKGAGIRVYEYASSDMIEKTRFQLEALFWLCNDAETVAVSNDMVAMNAAARKNAILAKCEALGLFDTSRLSEAGIIHPRGYTICPLCREPLTAQGFFNRLAQAKGRFVPDLTVTELNMFHIDELRIDVLNHRPYNLGWGHHHCNVVAKDDGIRQTLQWMDRVVQRNRKEGHFSPENNAS